MSGMFCIANLISLGIFSDLNDGKVSEIGSTFNNDRVINFLLDNQMIMASQNQINTFDILSQFNIVVFHHVSQCNDHITFVCLFQLTNHVFGELQEVNVMTKLFVKRIKCVNPLFFCQTKKSDSDSVLFNYFELQTFSQPPLSTVVINVR